MIAPVTYQGGKGRLAAEIVEKMAIPREATFYDLCCGSGTVSLAVVESGHNPGRVIMVERGPWGLFWEAVGKGTFDLGVFRDYCIAVPTDPRKVKARIEEWFRNKPIAGHEMYVFLLLQAAAVGGAAIWIEDGVWRRGSGFRDYWLPTATSSRRSPVNPMMPMPETIFERVAEIVVKMCGVRGACADVATTRFIESPAVVYIDPQYEGTTGYAYSINAVATARAAAAAGATCWVSEGKALSDEAICLSGGRAKGGITGDRKRAANEEWLSCFRPMDC